MIDYEKASPEVRAVFDDIMRTRGTKTITNFWKALATHPPTLKRTWESLKGIMHEKGAANGCDYCIASHSASARAHGASDAMIGETLAIVGMACETNALAKAYQVPIDEMFRKK
jgi:alkylhydroperoxidase family enzyme